MLHFVRPIKLRRPGSAARPPCQSSSHDGARGIVHNHHVRAEHPGDTLLADQGKRICWEDAPLDAESDVGTDGFSFLYLYDLTRSPGGTEGVRRVMDRHASTITQVGSTIRVDPDA